jgi:hypothetical protein
VIVINQGRNGRAYRAYGGGATFIGEIPLPLQINSSKSVFNHADNFGIEVINLKTNSVELRVVNGSVQPQHASLEADIEHRSSTIVSLGIHDFTKDGIHCVTGAWPVDRKLTALTARIKFNPPSLPQTFRPRWWVEDQELTPPSGTVTVNESVELSIPLPKGLQKHDQVTLRYMFEDDNTLRLFNDPKQGNYSVEVRCGATFGSTVDLATFDKKVPVDFAADELVFPPSYYDERNACLIKEEVLKHYRQRTRILLPGDLWGPMDHDRRILVAKIIDALERVAANPFENAPYRQLFLETTGYLPSKAKVFEADYRSLQELGIRGVSCSGAGTSEARSAGHKVLP